MRATAVHSRRRSRSASAAPNDVILAAAPSQATEGDVVARLLVPPAFLRQVTVDITDQPGEARPSRGLHAIAAAVAQGQAAARSERLRDEPTARRRWRRAAAEWKLAGDPARTGQALDYRDGGRQGRRDIERVPESLMSDHLADRGDL